MNQRLNLLRLEEDIFDGIVFQEEVVRSVEATFENEKASDEAAVNIERLKLYTNFLFKILDVLYEDDSIDDLKLRVNQLRALDGLINFLKNAGHGSSKGYFRQPTGAGKTILMGTILKLFNVRTLILVPNVNLLHQTKFALIKNLAIDESDIGIRGGHLNQEGRKFTIGTYAGLRKFKDRDYPLILCDEVHQGLGEKSQEHLEDIGFEDEVSGYDEGQFPTSLQIGFTATPRLSQKHVGDFFGEEIASATYKELIEAGFLKKIRLLHAEGNFYHDDLGHRSSYISPEHEDEILCREKSFEKLHAQYMALKEQVTGLKTAVFCATIEGAKKYKRLVEKDGIRAIVYTSTYSEGSLEDIEKGLTEGDLDMVISVGKLDEGWNYVDLNCVVLARATLSERKILQPVGRGMRANGLDDALYVIETQWNLISQFGAKGSSSLEKIDDHVGSKTVIVGDKKPLSIAEVLFDIEGDLSFVSAYDGGEIEVVSIEDIERERLRGIIIKRFPEPEIWAGLSYEDKKDLYFNLDGENFKLCAVASKFGVQGDPVGYIRYHFELGRIIYGKEHKCFEYCDVSKEEITEKVKSQIPTPEEWAKIKSTQRKSFKVKVGLKDFGLYWVANQLGVEGDPVGTNDIFLILGQEIYGVEHKCLEVQPKEEFTLVELISEIKSIHPTPEDWIAMNKRQRESYKVTIKGNTLGIVAIGGKFGIRDTNRSLDSFKRLGQEIYGPDHKCLQIVKKEKLTFEELKKELLIVAPTPEIWVSRARDIMKNGIKIKGRSVKINALARQFEVNKTITSHDDYLSLGQKIYGNEHSVLKIEEKKEFTNDAMIVAIKLLVGTAENWAQMTSHEKVEFKLTANSQEIGLNMIARLLGVDGNPLKDMCTYILLGREIYGENNDCLKNLPSQKGKYTLDQLESELLKKVSSAEDWVNLSTAQKRKFKIEIAGHKLGLNAISTKFGLPEGALNSRRAFLLLGQKLFGKDHKCLKIVEKD